VKQYKIIELGWSGLCRTSTEAQEVPLKEVLEQGWSIDRVLGWSVEEEKRHLLLARTDPRNTEPVIMDSPY
jgi:hypothetical protein